MVGWFEIGNPPPPVELPFRRSLPFNPAEMRVDDNLGIKELVRE